MTNQTARWSIGRKGMLIVAIPIAFQIATLSVVALQQQVEADTLDRERRIILAASIRRTQGILIAGLVLDFALAAGVITAVSRGFAHRLAIVIENTQRIERGEPLHELVDGNDEIFLIDKRLHEMADTVNTSRRALEESNADLESFSY